MAQSRTLESILRDAKQLRPVDRRKLLRALEEEPQSARADEREAARAALERFVARAGTGHSAFTDVAADKYKHLAEAFADKHE